MRHIVPRGIRHGILLAVTVGLFASAELAVRLLPLPRAARLFSIPLATRPAATSPDAGITAAEAITSLERSLIEAACRVACRWPLAYGSCLRAALVSGWVLRRHHPRLVLGVRSDALAADELSAHAWVELPGKGAAQPEGYLPLFTTAVSPGRAA